MVEKELQTHKQQHFRQRLFERFGVDIDLKQIEELSIKIEDYQPPPILVEKDGRSHHVITIEQSSVVVVYDWEHHTPVTCMPMSWFRKDGSGKYAQAYRKKSKQIRHTDRLISRTPEYAKDRILSEISNTRNRIKIKRLRG